MKGSFFNWRRGRIRKLLAPFVRYSDSIEQSRRIYLLIFLSMIGVMNLVPLGILALHQQNQILGLADLSVAAILVLNLINARGKKTFDRNILVGIVFTAILYIYLYLTGGVNNSGFVWYYTFPLIASYLLGSTKGAVASTLILFPVVVHGFVSFPQPFFTRYSADFELRFVFAYVVVFLFSYLFERTRENVRDELSVVQCSLEDQVKARTNELSKANVQLKLEIKERRHIEKELRKSEKNYRLITESTSDLIAITSFGLKPVYRYVSPSHKTVMGYESDDLLGKSGFDYIHPQDKRKLLPLLKSYATTKARKLLSMEELISGKKVEFRALTKSGDWRYLESTVNFIGKELLFVSKDITDRKRVDQEKRALMEKLTHSEKLETLGKLAAGVAHDLNNVLGAIVSYPDLLLMGLPKNSVYRKHLEAMKKSGQKAAAIINDLLSLARREVLQKKRLNLNDIVDEYLNSPEFMKLIGFHPGVKVETRLDPHLEEIDGSFVHLNKMVMNMISNAAEAMPSGGTIEISTENKRLESKVVGYQGYISEGYYSMLKIRDDGVGIEKKFINKIFEPFFSKKVLGRSGTGLGMSVVWGTVMDHNGNIVVKSAKKLGTTFSVYFPVSKGKNVFHSDSNKPNNYLGRGEKILIIDDEKDQRILAATLLTSLGYSVDTVPDGEQALRYLNKKTPSLIILDMIMKARMDGLDTYEQIIRINPGIKTIITSGYSETIRVKRAMKLGVKQYLKKPFTIEEIGHVVRAVLDKD